MHSCIYEGTVSHCRFEPVEHRFNYRLFMLFLDLAELPNIVENPNAVRDATAIQRKDVSVGAQVNARPLISGRKLALSSFLSTDHLNGVDALDGQVRELVFNQTGERPLGPIRLLTQLRYFGYYFSPLNLFYVYNSDGSRIDSVVAEVNNTPWRERHLYLLWDGNRRPENDSDFRSCYQHPKQMHVSPFMDMDMDYRWRLSDPQERLFVCLENYRDDQRLFAASMNFSRRELTPASLRWMTVRYPLMTFQIIAAIHYQALKLWLKKCPAYLHPNKRASTVPLSTITAPTGQSSMSVQSRTPQSTAVPPPLPRT